MKRPDVIIVGAGAAGLAAAQILSAEGCSILILEARDRIGGRIHTLRDSAYGMPVELGAEFVHGRPEVTWKLLREAKLAAFDLPFEHWMRRAGRLSHLGDFEAELGKVMGGLSHLGRHDVSFAQYLRDRRFPRALDEACRFAVNFVEGFDAADPERISSKSLAEEQRGIGDVGEETQFRLQTGYGSLVDYLHRSLNPKRVEIHLKTLAAEISWRRGHVEILTGSAGEVERFRAPRVLITLPVGVLQIPPETAGGIRFSPDIPEKRRAAMQLGSGPIVKAVLRFRESFWEERSVARRARSGEGLRDAVFLHVPEAAFPTWWTARPLRLPVLTAWAGGPKALALAALSREAIRRAAVESLAKLFGLSEARIASMVEGIHAHDWSSDSLSRGAYSYVAVGGGRARGALARAIDGTLFFAGEATDTSGQASTVAGALASGQRAARELLDVM